MPSLPTRSRGWGPRLFGSFLLCGGCAHAGVVAPSTTDDVGVQALRRDNVSLRRKVEDLEDRIVRLEHEGSARGLPDDRELPVLRLSPPKAAAADEPEPAPSRMRPLARDAGRSLGRRLGDLPDSAGVPEGYDDEPLLADGPTPSSTRGASYRLVGDRLVELTKANAPKRPDRPARDAAGNAILTEYETAMTLYKAGEIAGAERAFELFARAHAKHDYADNALYWKGEAAYDQKQFDEALTAFTEVVERYGGGNKAPDALLKIGLCYGKLGDGDNARDVLQGLVAAYPDAGASDIARTRLDELGS
jgi:tol-pal system protein YbgF